MSFDLSWLPWADLAGYTSFVIGVVTVCSLINDTLGSNFNGYLKTTSAPKRVRKAVKRTIMYSTNLLYNIIFSAGSLLLAALSLYGQPLAIDNIISCIAGAFLNVWIGVMITQFLWGIMWELRFPSFFLSLLPPIPVGKLLYPVLARLSWFSSYPLIFKGYMSYLLLDSEVEWDDVSDFL
jgi:hypothetical protein